MAHNITWRMLGDFVHRGANLCVTCGFCRRTTTFDAGELARYVSTRCWNSAIEALYSRFRCIRCGRRPAHIGPSREAANNPPCFPKTDAQWQQLARRLRG